MRRSLRLRFGEVVVLMSTSSPANMSFQLLRSSKIELRAIWKVEKKIDFFFNFPLMLGEATLKGMYGYPSFSFHPSECRFGFWGFRSIVTHERRHERNCFYLSIVFWLLSSDLALSTVCYCPDFGSPYHGKWVEPIGFRNPNAKPCKTDRQELEIFKMPLESSKSVE